MMGFIWFWLVAVMIVGYVVLDGFDLGVGVLHLFLVRTEEERRTTLASIGPVWDGNEVWLLAGGGTLYFAFPLLYASAFSGFYLPLMIVLWLLVLRGVSLELRNHIEVGVWRALLDGVFGLSSALLTIFFGAALANVLRGVPLQADGYFFLPLWTNWQPGSKPWHSGLVHGDRRSRGARSSYAARRAVAHHQDLGRVGRTRSPHRRSALAGADDSDGNQPGSHHCRAPGQPEQLLQLPGHVHRACWRLASLAGIWLFNRAAHPVKAFLSSCLYLFFMLAGACWGLYPTLLPATTGSGNDITLSRALSGPHTLAVGLVWWSFGMLLAVGYVVFVYGKFRGKVDLHAAGD